MLKNEFFNIQSDNNGVYPIVNLIGNQKYEQNRVFLPGTYRVDVLAGSTFIGIATDTPMTGNLGHGVGGRVSTDVIITEPFIIRAYCGSKGDYGVGGQNPYSGSFKVNAEYIAGTPSSVNHIFGNVGGSAAIDNQGVYYPGSGNCLGDGVGINAQSNIKHGIGAGSCLHFLPINGIFGTDYLFAAHCGAAATGWYGSPRCVAGCGSVYSGAAGGVALSASGYTLSAFNGGNTNFGSAGIGQVLPQSGGNTLLSDGTGVGSGKCWVAQNSAFITWPRRGSAAMFINGSWQDTGLYGEKNEDGHIIVTHLSAL